MKDTNQQARELLHKLHNMSVAIPSKDCMKCPMSQYVSQSVDVIDSLLDEITMLKIELIDIKDDYRENY